MKRYSRPLLYRSRSILQARFVRMRPFSPGLLRKAQKKGTETSDNDQEKAEQTKQRAQILAQKLSGVDKMSVEEAGKWLGAKKRTESRSRSRFNKVTEENDNDRIKSKSPAQIDRELKSRFKKDGIEYDPLFAQQMIKRSKQEEDLINDAIKGGDKIQKVTQDEVLSFVDWLIEDCKKRLPEQGKSNQEEVNEDLEKVMGVEDDDESLVDAFSSVYKLADKLGPSGLDKLFDFLKLLNQGGNGEMKKMVPLDRLVKLFEISGQLLDDRVRDQCVYLSGNLIYSSTPARADPINEKLYIESLVNHGEFKKALELYTSRQSKPDVVDQRFWYELGAEIYLRMSSDETVEAEKIACEIMEKFEYMHPLLISMFVERYLKLSDWDKAIGWWEKMKDVMNTYGLVDHIDIPGPQIVKDSQMVYNYYNRVDPVSWDNVTDCVVDFLKFRRITEAMIIIETATRRDKQYLLHFVDYLEHNVSYPGREYFIMTLENDADNDKQEQKFHSAISGYIRSELDPLRNTHCSSLDEATTLDELSFFLTKQLGNSSMSSENKLIISSLISSISIGSKLMSHECKDLLTILLKSHSRKGYALTSKVLDEMNKSFQLSQLHSTGLFPPASSHTYLVLVQAFGRRPQPKIPEIEALISTMQKLGIPMLTVLANQIVLAYRKAKQYTKALQFIDSFLQDEGSNRLKPTSEFFRNVMVTYRDSIASGGVDKGVRKLRLEKLRWMFKEMLETPGWEMNEPLCNETVVTFLTFGDVASTVCVLENYGLVLDKDISNDLMLAIKLKLEASVVKMESELNDHEKELLTSSIKKYRTDCGLLSIKTNLKPDKEYNWRDAACVLLRYMETFHYHPNPYSFADHWLASASFEQNEETKQKFSTQLKELQKFYSLPEVEIDEIL
ncbi:hypothetical protein FOA43_002476 [Brettanomyces nanus]|uniref:Uncharacterized protein n=1 Tax=Eeniella nana TaxID=13502 RepID=A0A875S2J0_EENNA|nr:uncharacterized protein FOA43_002476 [Brettanomyces nanus]QPG75133.1 hypothetical protein FOA43_002476 [Brettanomyces nanus]